MDSIYGIYKTDALKVISHRAHYAGLQHQHNISPVDPEPSDAVTVRTTTLATSTIEQVALIYTTDGSTPTGSRGVAENGHAILLEKERIEWDTLLWDFVIHWCAVIPAQPENTLVQYTISGWSANGTEIYADSPNAAVELQHATMRHYNSIPADQPVVQTGHFTGQHVFNYHVDHWQPPRWANWSTIYHIFLDRFCPGAGRDWRLTEAQGDVCGGTLWGVHDKLDYIADLGVNAIWLSPTWASPSFHGYDIINYRRVEPRLGGDAALRAVIEGAHERGIRVLLDMVCNHVSEMHPLFMEAKSAPNSPYRDWFMFDKRLPHGYQTFFGVKSMPCVNLAHPPARNWMIENALYWLREYDVDGFRLDVADGPSPTFWTHFRRACRQVKDDCLLFGEIVNTPHELRPYSGRLDGILDFPLNQAIRNTFGWEVMTEAQLDAFMRHNDAYYPASLLRPIFLDNHDMNRFSYAAGNDVEKMKRAAAFYLNLPGLAVVYYGSEVGIPQSESTEEKGYSACRAPMVWDDRQKADLLAVYKEAISARNQRRSSS